MLAKRHRKRTTDRRGVTLVEMLVTVAVLVIMMTILTQIFQAATGAMSSAQAYQQIDDQFRRLDDIIRSDLQGVTARFTPPLDPADNLGYFEYGENEFADSQGEDTDDYIRFTAKAPAGRPFSGRIWPNVWFNSTTGQTFRVVANNASSFPITVTSDFAEIIYFVRNGNLYRRVFLVAPDLQSSIVPTINNTGFPNNVASPFMPSIFGGSIPVSWQGVNDLSAHPAPTGPNANATPTALAQAQATIVLNTLGDLTNREKRAFYPRFANDFLNTDAAAGGNANVPDGLYDDFNGDNVPDLYPSMYPGVFNPTNLASQLIFAPSSNNNTTGAAQLASNPGVAFLGFPYVFPGAYSRAQAVADDRYGWIHAPSPNALDSAGNPYQFDTQTVQYLLNLNHNPLNGGDNLPVPSGNQASSQYQTWWGFPTWRETLSPSWNDPTVQVNAGLTPGTFTPAVPTGLNYGSLLVSQGKLSSPLGDTNLLPPMAAPSSFTGDFSLVRQTQQLFCDGAGQSSAFWGGATASQLPLWAVTWEDDLIMTNVRSFDVKAYDNALAGYGDLGWADDLRLYQQYQFMTGAFNLATPPLIAGTPTMIPGANQPYPALIPWPPVSPSVVPFTPVYKTLDTMAHEGRMPPLQSDHRLDAQYPNPFYTNYTAGNFTPPYPGFPSYSSNIGDDSNGIVRLRRVWDTWSTDYSRAPATGISKLNGGFPIGPLTGISPPIYPSYPAPYPAPLRGIQIQIRVVDSANQRVKQITIRQDFTDKL